MENRISSRLNFSKAVILSTGRKSGRNEKKKNLKSWGYAISSKVAKIWTTKVGMAMGQLSSSLAKIMTRSMSSAHSESSRTARGLLREMLNFKYKFHNIFKKKI